VTKLERVLTAVRAERVVERGARNRPWTDDAMWEAYIRARHNRQVAVDAWLKTLPSQQPEADPETVGMAL
jgi:hypothetical protein